MAQPCEPLSESPFHENIERVSVTEAEDVNAGKYTGIL
jgi:hypothetical protein